MDNSESVELASNGASAGGAAVDEHVLVPFIPRLVIEWVRESPDETHRVIDGTLAFVDISGFTSLTERLARKGKVGAEEMHEILDGVFTDLLGVAYDDGAGLVKWGGDAVLLLFDGQDHAGRACRAALNMQRTIGRVGRISASVGRVRLRMSVGIHAGAFDFFLVGDPDIHRELVMAGPAVTQTVRMEQLAEAGEVVLSRSPALTSDPGVLGRPREEGVLLRQAPDVPTLSGRSGVDPRGVELSHLVPLAVREYLMDPGEGQAEHRRITAAFLEFAGSDDLLAREGPEALGRALDATLRVVQAEARRHEVAFFETDVGKNAWRVMLIAGAPRSPGSDEDRMLDALRAIAEADLPFPVRMGTNAGHVFAGYFGPPFRKTYSVKGDAVNLAARVMARAEPGQLLATASVLDPATGLYATEELEPFAAKGKREPVHAWSVGRRFGSKAEGVELPFAGRIGELATLDRVIEDARAGRGSAVEIVGPPGMGKTRLLQQVSVMGSDLPQLRALCEPFLQEIAYRPFRAIVRSALDVPRDAAPEEAGARLRSVVEEIAPQLLPWLPLLAAVADADVPQTQEVGDLGDDFRASKLEEVAVAFLRSLFDTPTIVSFEDVHWMDAGSARLLDRLVRGVESLPWAVALTRRNETTGFVLPEYGGCRSLTLEAFTQDESEALIVAATEEEPLRRHDVALLAERSAGNPLFLGQLLTASRQAGSVEGLPLTVEALVTEQIDELGAFERNVLRHSAVLGVAFDEGMVARLLDRPDPIEADTWARLGGFLDEDGPGRRRYRHALMREAAYEGLPYRRRRELHARAAALIVARGGNDGDRDEMLSLHFFDAGKYEEAWTHSRLAAGRALAKYANVEAASFLERSVEAGREAGVLARDLADVLGALGNARLRMNEFAGALAAFAGGRQLVAGDSLDEAEFLFAEARVHYRAGRLSDAVRSARHGMRLVSESPRIEDQRTFARLLAFYAGLRASQGQYDETERVCRELMEVAEQVGDRAALARAYYVLDSVTIDRGVTGVETYSAKAVEIYHELGELDFEAEVISNMGVAAYNRGDWDQAIGLYERSRELKKRLGDDGEAAISTANIAEIRLDQGRVDEVDEPLAEALRVSLAGGYHVVEGFVLGLQGRARGLQGRFDEARALFRDARRIFEKGGNRPLVLEIDARVAELYVMEGDWRHATEVADSAIASAADLGGIPPRLPLLHRVRGFASMQAGSLQDAAAAFDESLAAARARGADHEVALTLEAISRLRALAGEPPEPAADTEVAATLARLGVRSLPPVPLPGPG